MSDQGDKLPVVDWVIFEDVAITRARAGQVPDEVWDRYLNDLRTHQTKVVLGLTTGITSLTATQRKATAEVLKTHGIFAAVLTDSALTRGLVTAVSWLGANTKSFGWDDIDRVLQLLDKDSATSAKIRSIVNDFQAQRK